MEHAGTVNIVAVLIHGVLEARLATPSKHDHAVVEQLLKVGWLFSLGHADLCGRTTRLVIQLLSEQGSSSLLIAGGGGTQPEINQLCASVTT